MSRRLFDDVHEIEARLAQASRLLVCLDFDGTLTPLRADPALPCLSPQMERALCLLANHSDIALAVISGRERADLQARVGIPGLFYAGNHGLEISGPGCLFIEPTAAEHGPVLEALAANLTQKLQHISGVVVENKGLTLSVHYRQVAAADSEEVRRLVHAILASMDHPFLLTAGHMIYEIRPRANWHKGNGVQWIMQQLGKPHALVIYVGDDTSDEEAFAAVRKGITVKVGEAEETAAQYRLEGPADVRHFLEWLECQWQHKDAGESARVDRGLTGTAVVTP